MARSSRGTALERSPWRRAKRPLPHKANVKLMGWSTASAIWSPLSPTDLPSANVPSSAWHAARYAGVNTAGRKLPGALVGLHSVQGRHGLRETVDRPTLIALGLVGDAEMQVRRQVERNLP